MVTTLAIILGIIYLLICVAVVVFTLLQDSKESGVSALGGADSSIFGGKSGTKESFLAKTTVALGILFAVIAIGLTLIITKWI